MCVYVSQRITKGLIVLSLCDLAWTSQGYCGNGRRDQPLEARYVLLVVSRRGCCKGHRLGDILIAYRLLIMNYKNQIAARRLPKYVGSFPVDTLLLNSAQSVGE